MAESEEDFEIILRSMSMTQLQDYVAQQIANLESGDAQLSAKRTKGWRKATTWLLPFAETFSQFLKAYSGIVNIFNSVDAQYGNVATAALSLLFAVCTGSSFGTESKADSCTGLSAQSPEREDHYIMLEANPRSTTRDDNIQ